jgi:hypothetical protein
MPDEDCEESSLRATWHEGFARADDEFLTHLQRLSERSRFVRLRTHFHFDLAEWDDVVQDSLLAAVVRPPIHDENLQGWFYTVLRHSCGRALQRRRRQCRLASRCDPSARPQEEQVGKQLVDMLNRLDERQRAEVLARFSEPLDRAILCLSDYTSGKQLAAECEATATELSRRKNKIRHELEWRLFESSMYARFPHPLDRHLISLMFAEQRLDLQQISHAYAIPVPALRERHNTLCLFLSKAIRDVTLAIGNKNAPDTREGRRLKRTLKAHKALDTRLRHILTVSHSEGASVRTK